MPAIAFFDFVTAINARDPDRLYDLMASDHVFVDSIGNQIQGSEACRDAWRGYFKLFPNYTVELTDCLETEHLVMASGFAMGAQWRIPAAWKVLLKDDRVAQWQVFADTKIPFESLEKPLAAEDFPRATSIGGVFFKCKNPDQLKEWYARHLGLRTDAYGTSFAWKQWKDGKQKGYTAWSPFPSDTTYFEPSQKEFMFNYRVVHLERLVAQLKEDGVTVLDAIESYPYGKFVHILDPENNNIELWEANDEAYSKVLKGVTY
jgi:predicted enzyme related to lactoylglutathione lyase